MNILSRGEYKYILRWNSKKYPSLSDFCIGANSSLPAFFCGFTYACVAFETSSVSENPTRQRKSTDHTCSKMYSMCKMVHTPSAIVSQKPGRYLAGKCTLGDRKS